MLKRADEKREDAKKYKGFGISFMAHWQFATNAVNLARNAVIESLACSEVDV
jgi:hypothetical protein